MKHKKIGTCERCGGDVAQMFGNLVHIAEDGHYIYWDHRIRLKDDEEEKETHPKEEASSQLQSKGEVSD